MKLTVSKAFSRAWSQHKLQLAEQAWLMASNEFSALQFAHDQVQSTLPSMASDRAATSSTYQHQ